MRTSKIVALVATAALLVVGTAFASFAAGKTGWDNSEGVWKYYKNGEMVTNDWAKSGSDYYYLDENGEMATDKLIEDTYIYYVDSEGKMVKNNWVKLANTDDDPTSEFIYYYFQKSGKAYQSTGSETKPSFKTIDGKKYAFDTEGKMLWGWISDHDLKDNDVEAKAWTEADYYLGDANDGAAVVSAWRKIAVQDDSADDIDQEYYFYFGSNGKKYANATKTIDGKKYIFGQYGNMLNAFNRCTPATGATASAGDYMYFSTAEDGARYAKKWFRVVSDKNINSTAYADETDHWYYAKSNAKLAANEFLTIGGKTYAFNDAGEMLSGLYAIKVADDGTKNIADPIPANTDPIDSISKVKVATAANVYYYYFGDEETDGSMKTGTTKITLDGDDYTFKFESSGTKKGRGITGVSSGSYYWNGVKITADSDQKYQMFKYTGTFDTKTISTLDLSEAVIKGTTNYIKNASQMKNEKKAEYVVLSNTGAVVKSGTKKDADGYKIIVTSPYTLSSITDPDGNAVTLK